MLTAAAGAIAKILQNSSLETSPAPPLAAPAQPDQTGGQLHEVNQSLTASCRAHRASLMARDRAEMAYRLCSRCHMHADHLSLQMPVGID